MATIYMVRHGRAAAGFGAHRDPGLDEFGRAQAARAAQELARMLPVPVAVFTSPLARTRETATPLVAMWDAQPVVEDRIAEIPSPTADLSERAAWLRGVMRGKWAELEPSLLEWHRAMIDWALAQETDAVAFSHFIAINVLAGAATNADDLITFAPDNGSITRLDNAGGTLKLVQRGREAQTRIN